MATERQSPDALLVQTNLSGAVTAIQDDPDSPDGNWLTAISNNADSVCVVSFPTPTGNPNPGAGLQEFRFWARLTPNGTACTYNVYLRENGTRLNGGAAIATGSLTSTTGQILSAPWDASLLGTADGSLVEAELVVVKSGGSPASRTTGEVGAVEWNVDYSSAATYDEATTLAMGAGVSPSAVMVMESTVSLGVSAGLSQANVAELLASLDLNTSAGVALAVTATMSAAIALNAAKGLASQGGAEFNEGASLGALFGVSDGANLEIPGAVGFGSDFGLAASAAADLVAGLSLDIQTQMTLGSAMILAAAITLGTLKGLSSEGEIPAAGNVYEEAVSLGMAGAITTALSYVAQAGIDLGISPGFSAGSQLDAEGAVSLDALFAEAVAAAWMGDVSIGLGMVASFITQGEIPTAVTAARRLFEAISRKRDFRAEPRGRAFVPVDRGRDFKGRGQEG